MALLRAYVDGQPAETPQHLRSTSTGPRPASSCSSPAIPGSTDRQLTVAELQTLRDGVLPPALLRASELRGRYAQFGKTSAAAERIVADPLFGLENGLKVQRKHLDALLDDDADAAQARRRADAAASACASDRALHAAIGDPWARIEQARACAKPRSLAAVRAIIEGGDGLQQPSVRATRGSLVRAAAERPKPNTDRLREYTDGFVPRIEQQLGAPVPIYPELERLTLSFSLERMREWLGPDHPVVRRLLATESPDALAARLVDGSQLADPAVTHGAMERRPGGDRRVATTR